MEWPWQRKEKQAAARESALEPLSDRKYESLFLSLLEAGTAEAVQAERLADRNFVSWLRRYGQTLRKNPAAHTALAQRMIALAEVDFGELSVLAGEIGQQLLAEGSAVAAQGVTVEDAQKDLAHDEHTVDVDNQVAFYLQQGGEAFERGDFVVAIAALDQVLQFKADFPEIHYNKGISLYNLGRYEEAIAAYDQALHFKADYPAAHYNKGVSLTNLGRYEEAITAYDQALHFKPDDHAAYYNKGVSLTNLGRYEEAIIAFDQALHFKSDLHEAHHNKGNSLADLGRYEEAIAAYDQALHFKADYPAAHSNKGNSLANLGRYEEAITAYDQALQFKPDFHAAHYNKGISLANLGRYEEAITAYDQALHFKPDKHDAWLNRSAAAYNSPECRTLVSFSLPPSLQDPSLNKRGYEGQIACYTVGLRHVQQSKNPEGWGLLHHQTGRAHYFHSHFHPSPNVYRLQAISAYNTALATLTAFPTSHLAVLQDAICAHLSLGDLEQVRTCREQGLEIFRQILNNAPTPTQKQQLEQQFSGFSQLQVDSLLRETNPTTALETAERYKNRTLTWLLDSWQETITSPSWADMRSLLTPSTAALYWHLSPESLTTFLLTPESSEPIAFTQPIAELETWLKNWNRQYQAYRSKGKTAEANKALDPWRTNLQASLHDLKRILQISKLETALQNISQLLLIPHRDLHRLPLHALFHLDPPRGLSVAEAQTTPEPLTRRLSVVVREASALAEAYLPSLQIGLNLKKRETATTPRAKLPLLNIANPKRDNTPRLESAALEATLIGLLFEQVDSVKSDQATLANVTAKLSAPNRILNFSGHAWAERQPSQSALYLYQDETQDDRLTAKAIQALPLSTYDLVTLSACETAVTSLETIESDYVGLASAFLTAGAANIVSTLWTVESESNAWLMVTFYQHYLAGDSPAVALKKAQHWLRTLTYAALATWLQQQQSQLYEQTHPGTYDALTARIGDIQSDPSKINSEQPPYADPYYWAAFTVTGYFS
jgi:CHAT domain-containing protein/Flp pilus assembly protein TadD